MSNFDKLRLSHPDLTGDFVADGNITFNEIQQYRYIFESGGDLLAGAGDLGGDDTSQLADVVEAFGNPGSRLLTISVTKSINDGLPWGSYDSYEDAVQLAQEIGHQLSYTEIDSRSPAILEFGEYSTAGRYSPMSVTIDELESPNDIGERQSSVRITFDCREILTLSDIKQSLP